ncbi:MAG TPA: hypothetical protein VEC18_04040, partial [Myxococcota bacterium]|nr:hypothetical protein [Myxococcota bacterium]
RFGAALAYEVIDARPDAHAHALAVERDLSRGARDRLAIAGRAVLAIAESAPRARYVSRHRIDAAHRAPDERAGRDECVARHERAERDEHIEGGDHIERGQRGRSDECGERMAGANDWRPVTPRVRLRDAATRMAGPAVERMNALFGIRAGGAEPSGSVVRGSAEECARQLIRYLGRHGFIERALAEQGESVSPESARARAPSRAHIAGVAVAQRGATAFGAERGSDAASASAAARDTADARPLSARVRRRPRPVAPGVRAVRGPFELGVDIA